MERQYVSMKYQTKGTDRKILGGFEALREHRKSCLMKECSFTCGVALKS